MKAFKEGGDVTPLILALVLNWDEWAASRTDRCTLGGENPVTNLVDPSSGLGTSRR